MEKGTEFRLFSHLWLGKHNSNVERNDIWIYVKVILLICGQVFYFGQVSFCRGFLLGVELWGEEPIMGPGETDLKRTCEMHFPVWKPAPDTSSCLSLLDACWVKRTRTENEDGCLKSESLQCRRLLLSVILSIPPGALLLKAFFWRLLLRDWEATADGSFSRGWWEPWETTPKSWAGKLWWCCGNRSTAKWGQEPPWQGDGCSPQWTSKGRDFPRQKCLVTRHILTVLANDNNARGSRLCMHTGTILFCVQCYGSCLLDWFTSRDSPKNSQGWSTHVKLVATKICGLQFFIKVMTPNKHLYCGLIIH